MNTPTPRAPSFWRSLGGYTTGFSRHLTIAGIASLFVGIIVALQPLAIQPIIDHGILRENATPQERMTWVIILAGGFILLSLLRVTIWGIGYRYLLTALEGTLFNIRARFFGHVQSLCFRFHDEVSSGELFNYVMGSPILTVKNFIQQFAMSVPYQIVSWSIAFIVLLYYDWLMLLILLGVVVAAIAINLRSGAIVRTVSAEFMKKENDASRYVADMFRGTRAIKIHAVEENTNQVFINQIVTIRDSGQFLGWRQWIEAAKPEVVQYTGMGILYMAGAYSCIYRNMSIGTFTAFINCVGVLMGPLMMMLNLNLMKSNAEAGLERIQRIMERVGTTPDPKEQQRVSIEQAVPAAADASPCIAFENVHFQYEKKSPVFAGLNVEIPDGQSVALVGHSGSGKSTFISLLLRLYDPQQGCIRLYGEDLRDLAQRDLRASFGVVMQDPFFFQASIRENILIGRPEASDEEIRHALTMAHAWDFVQEQPNGIHTLIGEAGVNLSGGQKQRLAIARALLSNPRFYIFDEATAALDNQSEARIQSAMDEMMKGHTTFIIAHRLSTICHVDRILVFDRGQIVQDGTYDELASKPGIFQNMLNHVS